MRLYFILCKPFYSEITINYNASKLDNWWVYIFLQQSSPPIHDFPVIGNWKKCNYLVFIEYNNLSREDTRRKHGNSKYIGKTVASYTYPSTADACWFVITPGTILNTFDFVTVNNFNSKTIGLVQDIRVMPYIALDDPPVYDELSNYRQENKKSHREQLLSSTKHELLLQVLL